MDEGSFPFMSSNSSKRLTLNTDIFVILIKVMKGNVHFYIVQKTGQLACSQHNGGAV